VSNNRQGIPTPDNGDPDGPTEGFLDDPTDWQYLIKGCIYYSLAGLDMLAIGIGIFNLTLDQFEFDTWEEYWEAVNELNDYLARTFENMTVEKQMILMLLLVRFEAEAMLVQACFIEAFDFWDFDKDGC
jgi:hypothetical protein